MPSISKKYLWIILLVAVLAVLSPYVSVYFKLGHVWPTVPVGIWNDADYYYDRMVEIKDGHPLLGNPYFFEHRQEIAPAFFLADWFAAIPLLLGVPLMPTILFDFFLWTLVFILFSFFLLRLLRLPPLWSLIGAILAYSHLYLFMIRPVSMQVVFPFFLLFLLAFVIWLKDTRNFKNSLFLAVSAGLSAYVYTYSWQIIVTLLFFTFLFFLIKKEKAALIDLMKVGLAFVLVSLPMIIFTLKQIGHPYYWETMARIGLVNTHLPTALAFVSSFWIIIGLLLLFLINRQGVDGEDSTKTGTADVFFGGSGLALISLLVSNVITGKELETAQHIERFVILWLILFLVYVFYRLLERNFHKGQSSRFSRWLTISLLLVSVCGSLRYLYIYGPVSAFYAYEYTPLTQEAQGYPNMLSWLNDNIPAESVIWTHPEGQFGNYIAMFTPHYLLFRMGGGLHLMSSAELERRFLAAHYFELSEPDLEKCFIDYAGVGNALHQYKTHNRQVRLCQIFRLERLGFACGEIEDAVSFKGKAYFTNLYDRYTKEVRPNIGQVLKEFHVGYAVRDNLHDGAFNPREIAGMKLIHTEGQFSIYKYEH